MINNSKMASKRGGKCKPVDVIINDQLELASLPAGSLVIESQVNMATKPWLGSGLTGTLYWHSDFWLQQTLESTKTVLGSMLHINVLVIAVIRLNY